MSRPTAHGGLGAFESHHNLSRALNLDFNMLPKELSIEVERE